MSSSSSAWSTVRSTTVATQRKRGSAPATLPQRERKPWQLEMPEEACRTSSSLALEWRDQTGYPVFGRRRLAVRAPRRGRILCSNSPLCLVPLLHEHVTKLPQARGLGACRGGGQLGGSQGGRREGEGRGPGKRATWRRQLAGKGSLLSASEANWVRGTRERGRINAHILTCYGSGCAGERPDRRLPGTAWQTPAAASAPVRGRRRLAAAPPLAGPRGAGPLKK